MPACIAGARGSAASHLACYGAAVSDTAATRSILAKMAAEPAHRRCFLALAAMALTVWESSEYWVTGRAPRALGSAHRLSAPYQALRAADGWFTVGANNDRLFEGLCRAIGRLELTADTRFSGRVERLRNRRALADEIEKTTVAAPRACWLERLDAAGVPAGPINTYPEALADPHALARGMVVDLEHPGAGPIKALGVPVKLSDTPGAVDRAAPLLGEHTAEILTELGYTEMEQRQLRDRGVI